MINEMEAILNDFAIFKIGIYQRIKQDLRGSNTVVFSFTPNTLLSRSQITIGLEEVGRELFENGVVPSIMPLNYQSTGKIQEYWVFTDRDKNIIDDLLHSHPHKFGMIKLSDKVA